MASSALAWVAATPLDGLRRPSAWVAATPSMASSALARVAADRVDGLVGPVDDAVHAVQQADDPVEQPSIRPTAAPTRGHQGQRLGDAVAHVAHRGEDVGRAGHRRQSHPGRRYAPLRWPTIRLRRRRSRSPAARPAVATAPSPRIVGTGARTGQRTTTRRCRHRWGISRRGTARVSRDVPGRHPSTARADADRAAAEPVTVEQVLARQGSAGRPPPRRPPRRGARARARRAGPAARRPRRAAAGPPVRGGLPPVARRGPARGAGPRRPAGPAAAARRRRAPAAAAGPAAWEPAEPPVPPQRPVPPLPGLAPPRRPARGRAAGAAGRRAARTGRRRAPADAGWAGRSLALAAVVGVVLLYHLGLYFYVDQKIDRVDALATDGPEVLAPRCRPARRTTSSSAAGVPGQKGAASVATLLASVSADGGPRGAGQLPADRAGRHPRVPHGRRRAAQPGHRGVRVVPARRRPVVHGPRGAAALRACGSTTTSASTWPGCPA